MCSKEELALDAHKRLQVISNLKQLYSTKELKNKAVLKLNALLCGP